MLRNDNTILTLERLLKRYFYGRPRELKQQVELRNAILQLLDLLVDLGSSAAFRMKDGFVTSHPRVRVFHPTTSRARSSLKAFWRSRCMRMLLRKRPRRMVERMYRNARNARVRGEP
jgi:hypothetical protein